MSEIEQHVISRDDAERLTERIRLTAVSFMETRDKLARYVREAQEGRAHEALGYRSWTEYIAQVFSDTPLMRLTRDERRVIVADLAEQGMSTRAIAPVVGVHHDTVASDVRATAPVGNPTPAPPTEPTFDPTPDWDRTTGEVLAGSGDNPPKVTGLDGKTYTRTEPKEAPKPRRRALTDTARDLGLDIKTMTDRVERFANDDRFPAQKSEVASYLRHHLAHAIEVLTDLNDQIN